MDKDQKSVPTLPLQVFADGTKTRRKLYLDGAERKARGNKSTAETAGGDGSEWAAAETW